MDKDRDGPPPFTFLLSPYPAFSSLRSITSSQVAYTSCLNLNPWTSDNCTLLLVQRTQCSVCDFELDEHAIVGKHDVVPGMYEIPKDIGRHVQRSILQDSVDRRCKSCEAIQGLVLDIRPDFEAVSLVRENGFGTKIAISTNHDRCEADFLHSIGAWRGQDVLVVPPEFWGRQLVGSTGSDEAPAQAVT